MRACASAGGGFLLAVLWFDLMFDVQARGSSERELDEARLASIAAYYARVTTAARPMNRLIATVMLATLAALVVEIADGGAPTAIAWGSLGLAAAPILLAAGRTVPSAVRLGARSDSAAVQSRLARSIYREHVLCASSIAALLILQLALA